AGIDIAHRDFPARGLSIFRDPGGNHPEGRCHHLHQRVSHLLVCGADSRLFCGASRPGEGAEIRIELSRCACAKRLLSSSAVDTAAATTPGKYPTHGKRNDNPQPTRSRV